jgi:hypothetical protein
MTQGYKLIAEQLVSDFALGASYQQLMAKYHLTQQEVEILVEEFFPSTISQEITLIDWKSQTDKGSWQPDEHSEAPTTFSLLNLLRGRAPHGKLSISRFKKFFRKRK